MISEEHKASLLSLCQSQLASAYCPYSHYPVGAAVLAGKRLSPLGSSIELDATQDFQIFPGCNVECCAYPLSKCAEQVAIHNAVSQGYTVIVAVAVAISRGQAAASPCGGCRQVMVEFAVNQDIPVLLFNQHTDQLVESRLSDLLPMAFCPSKLQC